MKTKNVRVRVSDIKQGRIICVASPFYGISKYIISSRPYIHIHNWLFFDSINEYGGKDRHSIEDAGINSGNSYNDRKTFFKLKQAKEWASKMKTNKQVITRHEKHLESCKSMNYMGSNWV